jgi:hypothetical protein
MPAYAKRVIGTARTDWPNKKRYLRDVLDYFGRETAIATISEAKAADLAQHLLGKPVTIWKGGCSRRRDDPDADKYRKPSKAERAHKMRDELNRRVIDIMKAIEKKYGRRFRWHDLRAAFITHVAKTSGGIAAQALARHSDFGTTQAYIEIVGDLKIA